MARGGDLLVALPPPVGAFSLLSGHCSGLVGCHLLAVPAGGWDDGAGGSAGSARLVGSVPGTGDLLSLLPPCHPCTRVPGPSIPVIALSKRLGCLVALNNPNSPLGCWQDPFIPPPMAGPWTSPLCHRGSTSLPSAGASSRRTDESGVPGLLPCIRKRSCSYRARCRLGRCFYSPG